MSDTRMRDADAIAIIGDLVSFPTISSNPNRDLLGYVARFLDRYGVDSDILWNEDGSKGNLWATIGPAGVPGVILSGHSDVVPTEGQAWTGDPFTLRAADGRIYGRGTCDMKGFIGTVLAAVPDLVGRKLKAPIHIAISYDEEVGCTGVTSLIDRLAALPSKPALCIVGEPTDMQVIVGHKGIGVYTVTVTGQAAHASQAPYAVNAIEYAADIVAFVTSLAREQVRHGPHDHDYDISHSTISVTTIHGGTALNIIPGHCVFQFDIRALPAVDMRAVVTRIEDYVRAEIIPRMQAVSPECGVCIEPVVDVTGLSTGTSHPAVTFMKALVRRNDHGRVDYCTEAGLFSTRAGIVSVVCGPGSMQQGHKPDEFVSLPQIDQCRQMIAELADQLEAAGLPW